MGVEKQLQQRDLCRRVGSAYAQISLNTAHPAGSTSLDFKLYSRASAGILVTDGCLETRPLTSGHCTTELFSVDEICYQVPPCPIFFTIWTKSLVVCTFVLSTSNYLAFHNCVPGQSLTLVLRLESHFMICDSSLFSAPLGSLVLNNRFKKNSIVFINYTHSTAYHKDIY